jgi:hypothetical protein
MIAIETRYRKALHMSVLPTDDERRICPTAPMNELVVL